MIISVEDLRSAGNGQFDALSDETLKRKLIALESAIRAYTHNNFQDVRVRSDFASAGNVLLGENPFLRVGDTVQLSKSINNGLYVITGIVGGRTTLDGALLDTPSNLVTKVIYPPVIAEGVINLMLWEATGREKVGIKSESLSRHTVTYFDMDSNSLMGYPSSLLGFLNPFRKLNYC